MIVTKIVPALFSLFIVDLLVLQHVLKVVPAHPDPACYFHWSHIFLDVKVCHPSSHLRSAGRTMTGGQAGSWGLPWGAPRKAPMACISSHLIDLPASTLVPLRVFHPVARGTLLECRSDHAMSSLCSKPSRTPLPTLSQRSGPV